MDNFHQKDQDLTKLLEEKARWVRKETFKIYKISPGIRLASSLSDVEILVALYYGGVLKFDPQNPYWEGRDRFIASKGHGSISLYPILADLGFFDLKELARISHEGSFLADIPDTRIPGYETINGSLGHGPGVACGIAIGLQKKKSDARVFVLTGDGELNEGSVWEAVMFAGHHKLNNLILIVDNNKTSMLSRSKDIIDLEPLEKKFSDFGWKVVRIDGHNAMNVYETLKNLKEDTSGYPKVLIADTIKGKGVSQLESDAMSHSRVLKVEEIIDAERQLQ
ncbi:MAG: transketolase [Candidatus Jorgensenbacteria bacterium]|nr:transketolase [Candidatus Jorgensenbacteria bacterium]